jgi:hypothetical protein
VQYIGCVIYSVRCPVEDGAKTGFRFMSGTKNFLCPNRRCSIPSNLFVWAGAALSSVIKKPAREADHFLPASDEV